MKKFISFVLMMLGVSVFASQFYYNEFTTTNDWGVLNLATNIVKGAIQGNFTASLNPGEIEVAGGLTTNNYATYTDTNGAAVYQYGLATNYASTNLPSNLVTQSQLASASNSVWTSSTNYAVQQSFVVANSVYSNNPSGYLTPSATNNITALGNAVVTAIQSGGGFTVVPSQTALGISYTITATGTNNVNVTNLNATSLATYGALTTNSYSWSAYVAPINDWTNASVYTNALLRVSVAASTYQPIGNYLASGSSLNYNNVTNPPTIPSTNGFVTSGVTNGLATTNWVVSQGYTNSGILTTYATTNYVANVLLNTITASELNSESNSLQVQISSNATAIAGTWPTNISLVGNVVVSSNMTVSLSTNNGVITATLGSYGGAAVGYQPTNSNLTAWSTIPTNGILLTTNIVTSVVAGSNITVTNTVSTNGIGITCVIGASLYANQTPSCWQSVTFTTPTNGTAYNGSWSTPLVASPTSLNVYYAGVARTVFSLSADGNGFSYTDPYGVIGSNKVVTVIGICQ